MEINTIYSGLVRSLLAIATLVMPVAAWADCTNCSTSTDAGDVLNIFNSGTGTFTAPSGVTSVTVQAWGGGGGGTTNTGFNGGGGGGGGAFAGRTFSVTPGNTYDISVGNGGNAGANGGNSSFIADVSANNVIAAGGGGNGNTANGAAGGTAGASTGGVTRSGGAGGNGATSGSAFSRGGGGGGGSATAVANGGNGANGVSGGGGAGGNGEGNGGAGGNYSNNGAAGNTPGGGGGGRGGVFFSTTTSGAGSNGRVIVRYTPGSAFECPAGESLTSGLLGSYYDYTGESFPPPFPTGTATGTRVDGPVDFNWGNGDPGVTGIDNDEFAVRWDGAVYVEDTGNYQFQTVSDDGVRLFVNDQLIIDNWTDHSAQTDTSGNVSLTGGQAVSIRLEFYENGGLAEIRLRWRQGTGGLFNVIPAGPAPGPGDGLYYCEVIPAPVPILEYRMDESAWNGTAGEVIDNTGNGFDGTAQNGADTDDTDPAIDANPGTCGYGEFDGNNDFVVDADADTYLEGLSAITVTAWVRNDGSIGNDRGIFATVSPQNDDNRLGLRYDSSGFFGGGTRVIKASISTTAGAHQIETVSNVQTNNWQHIAFVWEAGEVIRVVIDGATVGTTHADTAIGGTINNINGLFVGRGVKSGQPYWQGAIDEFRIYDAALSDAEIATIRDETHPCDLVLIDHIRIEHAGVGLTCTPVAVTVRACEDAACTTESADPVTTTLQPTGWIGGDTINFTGSTAAELAQTTAATIILDAVSTTPAPTNPARCFVGATETCEVVVRDSGFIFDVPDHVSDTVQTISIAAVQTDPVDPGNACVPAFTEPKTVNFWSSYLNPGTGTLALELDGTPIAGAGPGTGISLAFDSNAEASFDLQYADVGQLRLDARYDGSGDDAGLVMLGNSMFVVKPSHFTLAITGNPAAADANGGTFTRAGEDFNIDVSARNASNNITPNFGQETSPESVQLDLTLAAPAGGNAPALNGGFGAFSSGEADGDFNWPEVGIITLEPRLDDGDYLGAGDVVGNASGNIGRFIPYDFDVDLNTPEFASACTGGANDFSYLGQTFDYQTAPEMTVTAKSRNKGNTTQNYTADFFKLTDAKLSSDGNKTYSAETGTLDTNLVNTPDPAITDNGDGSATLTFNSGTGFAFTRTAPQAPFDAEISLSLNVIDTDNVVYGDGVGGNENPAVFAEASAGNGIDFADSKEQRWGRLRLVNASGSELLPLQVPVLAEYFDGTSFIPNTDDACTSIALSDFSLDTLFGDSVASPAAIALVAGQATLNISAPNVVGFVDIEALLAAPVPSLVYLQDDWDGDGNFDNNPTARATFGIFAGNKDLIYIREPW